jgi:hypothetical protein
MGLSTNTTTLRHPQRLRRLPPWHEVFGTLVQSLNAKYLDSSRSPRLQFNAAAASASEQNWLSLGQIFGMRDVR